MNVFKNIEINMIEKTAKQPQRATTGSAGYDIFMHGEHTVHAKSFLEIDLPFNFKGELNQSVKIRVFVRSSYGFKKKIRLVDENYNIVPFIELNLNEKSHTIRLYNDHDEDLVIPNGEHFAQFILSERECAVEKTTLEPVKQEELRKHNITKSSIDVITPNVYTYVLQEEITFQPGEQKMLASGLKGLIDEGTWLGVYVHDNVKDKIILANGIGIVDKDYAYNVENDGLMFFAFVNITNDELLIKKGTPIAKLWSEKYYMFENEIKVDVVRIGGVGSTTEKEETK